MKNIKLHIVTGIKVCLKFLIWKEILLIQGKKRHPDDWSKTLNEISDFPRLIFPSVLVGQMTKNDGW